MKNKKKIGILLTNTGTPDDTSVKSVRRYLRQFLSDRRIIQLPRILWLPILYTCVLTIRPRRSSLLYQKIWQNEDAPLRKIMRTIANKLEEQYKSSLKHNHAGLEYYIEIGMNYGNPSIGSALKKLNEVNVDQLLVLPLFPQYSNTTTASSFDRIHLALKKWSRLPQISFVSNYADNQTYINALAANTKAYWQQHGKGQHLLISFHGIPKRYVETGDPYATQCEITANLLAEKLNLSSKEWTLCYQSQFGYDKWLKPATQSLLMELPQSDIRNIDIICPGFAVDCLETLEEIAIRGLHTYQKAGGESLRYIPALNEQDEHIQLLASILDNYAIRL